MKSELKEDQLSNAVVEPKLDTHLLEGDTVVMQSGVVPKTKNYLPSKSPSPHLRHDIDTNSVGLDVEKTFFWRTAYKQSTLPLSGLREKMDSSLCVCTVRCEDADGSKELILLFEFFFLQH